MDAMAVDPTLAVAVTSVLTAAISVVGGVAVAVVNNRRETTNAAETAAEGEAEKAREEREAATAARLALRDEQIDALEWKVRNREARIAQLEIDLAAAQAENQRLKGQTSE